MGCPSAPSLRGFLTVSSMDKMRQVASHAAPMALIFTSAGSQMKASYASRTPPVFTSTPKLAPSPPTSACFCRSLFSTSVASNPLLSHSCRGITSSALANALMNSWPLPAMPRAWSRRWRESSMSMAPPPGTMAAFLTARRTISMASLRDLAASSMNCSAPPLSTMVHVLDPGHPRNRLKRSLPTCLSSNTSHVPSCSGVTSFTVVCTLAPVALVTRSKSSSVTRPAQKTPRSAKYCVARSPMASRERMIFAPDATHFSSLSYMMFHSASTIS
mmetsp:Transcript_6320/g.27836  ORF Transcript_6320/g.27836 Transcript_6320/m.27836 type:complete len:273 (+) Transcript_6320:807-1625(+)